MNKLLHLLMKGICLIVVMVVFISPLTSAQAVTTTDATNNEKIGFSVSIVPFKCWQSELGCSFCDIALIFTNAANIIATAVSGASLLMFIIGGMMMIFSNGNEERVSSGRKILVGTVIGLLIVFLAWFAVNVIVRLTAQASTGTANDSIFTTQWWQQPACHPSETNCSGKYVGDQCGNDGACRGKDKTGCVCYRPINPDGDNNKCDTSAESQDKATVANKACYCAIGCELLNEIKKYRSDLQGYDWKCEAAPTTDSMKQTYEEKFDYPPISVSCPSKDQVCVGESIKN